MSGKQETVEEITARWNPPPTDDGLTLVVGEPVPEGWGLATNASTNGLTEDGAVPVDKGGDNAEGERVPYRKQKVDQLRDEAGKRGLSKSGNKEDLIERLVDFDVNGPDDGDVEEDEDEDDES
jgi:hypothetical protein